ncbi:MAG TPA: hypothetical protein VMF61_09540 [Candidatus Acidoferrales bacterium]|nr:hypothetical protein [Candidatus Acidoferrales bacterium]
MDYVEWLRARCALKWTAIVLGAIVVLAAIARIAVWQTHDNVLSWAESQERDPDAKRTETTLPDGTHRTEYVNARTGVRVTVLDRGWNGKEITVYDPSGRNDRDVAVAGPVRVTELPHGRGSLISVRTDQPESFAHFFALGCFVALVVATCLGAPLARENDGHLETAFTKPIERSALALRIFAADAVAVVGTFAMGTVTAVVAQILFQRPNYVFGWSESVALAVALLGVLAWYAMLTGATASVRRGYGVIVGLAWPVALGVLGLASADSLGGNPILLALHQGARVLNVLNPLGYMHFGDDVGAGPAILTGLWVKIAVLAALLVAYGLAAIVQWRRVEA